MIVLVGATSPEKGGQARLGLCSPLGPHVSVELKKGSCSRELPGGVEGEVLYLLPSRCGALCR